MGSPSLSGPRSAAPSSILLGGHPSPRLHSASRALNHLLPASALLCPATGALAWGSARTCTEGCPPLWAGGQQPTPAI